MSRAISNLIIFLSICMILTVKPINVTSFNFDFSFDKFKAWESTKKDDSKEATNDQSSQTDLKAENDDSLFSFTAAENVTLSNPEIVSFTIVGPDMVNYTPDLVNSITYSFENLSNPDASMILSSNEVAIQKEISQDNKSLMISLEVNDLKLSSGIYDLTIVSDLDTFSKENSLSFTIKNLDELVYAKAKNLTNSANYALTVYHPNESELNIVPVTYEIPNAKLLRSLANKMAETPTNATGILNKAPSFKMNSIAFSGGVVTFSVKKYDVDAYIEAGNDSSLLLESLTKSYGSIGGVNSLRFFVDGDENTDLVPGTKISNPYTIDRTPKLYLAQINGENTVHLIEVPWAPKTDDPVSELLGKLKFPKYSDEVNRTLINTIPEGVKILSISRETNLVNITLDVTTASIDQMSAELMIDSIVQTLSSIEGINGVKFTLSGTDNTELGNVDMSKVFYRKSMINPSK